ncbi:phosphate ABC transporter permease subunit PstC [Roseovarius nanhaiticus]|uniref:phosphate ABC transporter permease subunit PstC n=1 Tax=Roseovarius nanhaiticus TaxID=573024 RepID=UPI00248F7FC5|nr:phosphate ABC transporter permease subunit PstC [Roseovarius nanhaiticus]
MSLTVLALILIALGMTAYVSGRARALASAGGDSRALHSLPRYYGAHAAMLALVPAVGILALWLVAQPLVLSGAVSGMLPEGNDSGLMLSDVRRVADGLGAAVAQGVVNADEARALEADGTLRALLAGVGAPLASDVSAPVLAAAQEWRRLDARGDLIMAAVALIAALAGLAIAWRRTDKDMRARNRVESGVRMLLIAAASIAVLTTIGIVLSLVFTTIEFFRIYPASDFFFGTTWSPSFGGGSELGVLPLLWGTLYISVIALLVAVPIGLFSAIYLSEYASPRVRGIVKPLLEVLAGIPTIVYGLFALLTVGPLLLSVFGRDGLGWMQAGTAVMTAGLVMGIMLIPFVSSLSDDIMGGVPQALRDGSYGLGATKSETIRQVVLPAALPGIVGAVLLAASRAIGETMIVVLGVGAAAKLGLNPFDAMTTVTAKIVSQLTGDADFASPEALVAFALGMTLFVITLGLNVIALWIVRRYREQYE